MKKLWAALALAVILLLSWVTPAAAWDSNNNYGGSWGNTGSRDISWATSFYYKMGCGTVTADLNAGKTGTIGTVIVWETPGNVNVRYETSDVWKIDKTALHIGRGFTCDIAENKIPQDFKGNYKPDNFMKHDSFNPAVSFTYTIAENNSLGSGSWLCIAAYAEVINTNQHLDAWGDIAPVSPWKLPTTSITMQLTLPGADLLHSFDIDLSGVGTGYSINNSDTYGGWCGDSDQVIDTYPTHSVFVFSSLNLFYPKAPQDVKNLRWDKINYLLNHHDPDADWLDVQNAIWYFTNNLPVAPGSMAETLVKDARDHGDRFVPCAGQVGAVILYPGDPDQFVFIELFVPTKCLQESTCRHSCDPKWSSINNYWNCGNWSDGEHTWNPCSSINHSGIITNTGTKYQWDSKCSPIKNLTNFRNIGHNGR